MDGWKEGMKDYWMDITILNQETRQMAGENRVSFNDTLD